jgi:hypothetical protein
MDKEPFRMIVEIPEVPLRGLESDDQAVQKLDELQNELERSIITFNKTLRKDN